MEHGQKVTIVYAKPPHPPRNLPYYGEGEELGWRLFSFPLEVRMAWESAGVEGRRRNPDRGRFFWQGRSGGRGILGPELEGYQGEDGPLA